MKPGEKALQEQVDFLLDQLRQKAIDIHQFMQLLAMAYGDYLDFHPEERPGTYDRKRMEQSCRQQLRNHEDTQSGTVKD